MPESWFGARSERAEGTSALVLMLCCIMYYHLGAGAKTQGDGGGGYTWAGEEVEEVGRSRRRRAYAPFVHCALHRVARKGRY